MQCICIHRQFIIAVKNGNGIGRHFFNKPLAVLDKYLRVQGKVFHDRNCLLKIAFADT
jgi:hypothetical protein